MKHTSTLIMLPLALLLASGTFAMLNVHPAAAASTATPADQFIRSVVTRDGNLGWNQLCVPLQQALPRQTLESVTQAQKAAEAGTGLTLTSTFVSQRLQPSGGQVRVYELSAHRADGWSGQRTYSVFTAQGGCVDDVQTAG
jgi:DNA-binding transcriptional LysR family regulator